MIWKKKGKWYCIIDFECVNVVCLLFIVIDLLICKLYCEFKNDYMYVWNYYFYFISLVLMIMYYFVCVFL